MTSNCTAQEDKLLGHFTVTKMLYFSLPETEIKSCAYERFLMENDRGSILTEEQLRTFSAHLNQD